MRKTLIAFAATIACIPMVVLGLNAAVVLGGSGTTHDVGDAPHRQAALVLGAQVRPDGRPVVDARSTASKSPWGALPRRARR